MNKITAQRLAEIEATSGFVVTENTTEQEVREYFTYENFCAMFGADVVDQTDEEIRADGDYIVMYGLN